MSYPTAHQDVPRMRTQSSASLAEVRALSAIGRASHTQSDDSPKARLHIIPRTIQGRLFLLLFVVLVPVLLIQALVYYYSFQSRRAGELQANLEVARAVGRTFEAYLKDILHQELAIALAATASPPLSSLDFNRLLEKSARDHTGIRDFSWVSPEGRILASSNPLLPGTDITDRAYFQEIVSGRSWVVSDLYNSRATGKPVFSISRGIRDEWGNLLGISLAVVVPERLDSVLAVERTKGGKISLADSSGVLVYQFPHQDVTWEDRDLYRAHSASQEALDGREAAEVATNVHTGSKLMIARTPVRSIGWVAGAGRTEEEAMRGITLTFLRHGVMILSVALVSFLIALRISRAITRPIKSIHNHALLLGQGNWGTRVEVSGPSEVQDLAGALNRMAWEQKKADEALRKSEERYRAIVEDQIELVSRFQLDGTLTFANQAYCRYFNESLDQLIGRRFWYHIPEEDLKRLKSYIASFDESNPVQTIQHQVITGSGEVRWQEWTDRLILDEKGKPMEIQAVGRDITDQKQAEERLRNSERELRSLSARLLNAQEEERKRIAQGLHDSIGSLLTAIKISLESLQKQLEDGKATGSSLELPIRCTRQAIEETRRIMTDLRPSVLDDLGLLPAIGWFVRQYQEIYPEISVDETVEIDERDIPEDLKIVVFRIIQEAFHNIAKYSQAEFAALSLMKVDSAMELSIEDKGVGFDLCSIANNCGHGKKLGLSGMRERAELSGGAFSIESVPGEGTVIRVSWPLNGGE